jgi:multiple antibiotic resistance protein
VLDWVISGTAYVSGALVTALGVYLTYRYARRLLRFMGEMGTTVVMRLSAFILLCIGFEIMWTGLSALIEELK